MKSLVSIHDFSKSEILKIMELAAYYEAYPYENILNGHVVATLFF